MNFLFLVVVGLILGVYSAMIGVGGGFLLIPFLMFLHPDKDPGFITSISLTIVFLNSLAGSVAYGRLGRIDFKSGLLFSPATIPGAILGALSTAYVPRRAFDLFFGCLLIAVSVFLIVKRGIKITAGKPSPPRFAVVRELEERNGNKHSYSFNYLLGAALSFSEGYLSSVLGIGGGIIYVPAFIHLLNFPIQIATATSLFIVMLTAGTATLVHILSGAFFQGLSHTLALAIGALLGAPLGVKFSARMQDRRLIQALAFAILLVGLRTIVAAF